MDNSRLANGGDEAEDKNLWSLMLKDARAKSKGKHLNSDQSTLYFVGDAQSGKTTLLSQWKDRVASKEDIPELILDYSYVNVKNKFDPTTTEVISRMGIWQINDVAHSELLPKIACDPHNAAFVINLDLSKPYLILDSLNKWLNVYKKTATELLASYTEEHSKTLKTNISTYIQTFKDTTEEKKEEGKEEEKKEEGKEEEKKEEEKPVDIDASIPAENYGIPLFIVGLQGDSWEKTGNDERFGFVLRRLRQEALKYGATLIFTSSNRGGVNVDVLEDHIFHRLFGLPLNHKPKTTGKCTQWQIHIPAGLDKEEKINTSTISDSMSLADVFDYIEEAKEEKKEEQVSCKTDQEFFDSLKGKLTTGRRDFHSEGTSHNKKKKEKAVKSFFKSLLNTET